MNNSGYCIKMGILRKRVKVSLGNDVNDYKNT